MNYSVGDKAGAIYRLCLPVCGSPAGRVCTECHLGISPTPPVVLSTVTFPLPGKSENESMMIFTHLYGYACLF